MKPTDISQFARQIASVDPLATLRNGVSAEYARLVENHFHQLDLERTRIPFWPAEVDLVPAARLRGLVGPLGYRYYMYGLGEHYWLIRGLCGFRGDQNLLDIGCGCGKTALALMNTIRPPGSYTGFDIQPVLVEFVDRLFKQQRISSHFHVDCFPIVGNKYYSGTRQGVSAEAFEFPYADERFDMAVSFSVFTHLRNRAMVNYVNNLGRVMRRGSKLLLSFYLLDNSPEGNRGGDPWRPSQRREALMRSPRSADSADGDVLRVLKPEMPEFLVAYRLDHLLETFEKYGFSLSREPMFGSWSGRSDFFGHQDYLVFERK